MACHRGSGRQVLSCSDALISQPFCCRCQVSEMMLTLMGGQHVWEDQMPRQQQMRSTPHSMLIFALEK